MNDENQGLEWEPIVPPDRDTRPMTEEHIDVSLLAREIVRLSCEQDNLIAAGHAEMLRADAAEAVIDWLRENMPRALELCPYKIGGGSVSREARGLETREPTGGASRFPTSPPINRTVGHGEVL